MSHPHPKPTYKRRHFFIKKKFQSRFMLRFGLLVLMGAFVSTALFLFFSRGTQTALFSQSRLVITDTARYILPAVMYTNLVTIIVIALSTIVLALFVSHKMAGPLFRLEKEVKSIAEGDLSIKIRLRNKDQLRELAEDINEMAAHLNKKVSEIRTEMEDLISAATENRAPQWFQEEIQRLYREMDDNFKL